MLLNLFPLVVGGFGPRAKDGIAERHSLWGIIDYLDGIDPSVVEVGFLLEVGVAVPATEPSDASQDQISKLCGVVPA